MSPSKGSVICATALLLGLHTLLAQQPAFRTGVVSIPVYATVTDRSGRLVTSLQRDDFEVRDEGRPVQITTFSNEPQAITAVLLMDVSFVLVPRFPQIREAALRFVDALKPGDRARIGTLSSEIAISPILTGDKDLLRSIVDEELWPGGGASPLWQAMNASMDALARETGRRVLIALSVGGITGGGNLPSSRVTADHLARRFRDEDFQLYGIRLQGRWGNDPQLRFLTRDTGGGYFELAPDVNVAGTFERVVEELRSQYLLGFTPIAFDGKAHQLEVRVRQPNLQVRARRSYLAPSR